MRHHHRGRSTNYIAKLQLDKVLWGQIPDLPLSSTTPSCTKDTVADRTTDCCLPPVSVLLFGLFIHIGRWQACDHWPVFFGLRPIQFIFLSDFLFCHPSRKEWNGSPTHNLLGVEGYAIRHTTLCHANMTDGDWPRWWSPETETNRPSDRHSLLVFFLFLAHFPPLLCCRICVICHKCGRSVFNFPPEGSTVEIITAMSQTVLLLFLVLLLSSAFISVYCLHYSTWWSLRSTLSVPESTQNM